MSNNRSGGFQTFQSGLRVLLWLALAVTVGIVLEALHATYVASAAKNNLSEATIRTMGLVPRTAKHLASQFTDKQGRLLADPPSSPDQLLDPETIVVAHLTDGDSDNPLIPWEQFESHLATVTGRRVTDQSFENNPDDLDQIKEGKITLVALHAAETPFLVNNCGFQPIAVLGDNSGAEGNHLDIIVSADSGITQSSGLRGHTLVCTVPSSITGYRAAIALLSHNDGLRPNVDYDVTCSMKQKNSIIGIAKHLLHIDSTHSVPVQYDAAAVSDDKLQSYLKREKISPTEFRIIYQSEVIPRTTIGCFYNLNPALAAKIREAILSFKPDKKAAKSEADDADADVADSSSAKHMHFIAVDYKRDFQLVREIDDSFDPRLGAKLKQHAAPTTAP